eukprot:TRINITY_DN77195_c0_g1_i1.p1 TRINITY_DN77195_c0_g1~~TRINITY_DN77195_c0_g1_i1.p1  ORF type:complete len:175 (+),score=33.51 TRINITY_DN77195_c0_g1_i1:81-605(+)
MATEHPPPAPPVEHDGAKFRQCAAAVVFNAQGEVLVGERISAAGSWQFPQGGLDAGETVSQAASRELYEEMGVSGHPALFEAPSDPACFYRIEGGWLSRNGFAGQHLGFAAFYAPDALTQLNLSGLGGEKPEFSQAKWTDFDSLVSNVYPAKRAPYAYALACLKPRIVAHLSRL